MRPFFLGLLLVLPLLSGCLSTPEDESPPAFEWPEPEPILGCELTAGSNLSCDQRLSTPSAVIEIAPFGSDVLVGMLDGTIARWVGDEAQVLVNLTASVSTCHNEQGLICASVGVDGLEGKQTLFVVARADRGHRRQRKHKSSPARLR